MTKILITGASGFLGKHLCRAFLENGDTVYALLHHTKQLDMDHPNLHYRYGDLCDIQSISSSLKGIDGVIHNGAMVQDWGKKEDFFKVNAAGTRNLLQACLEHNIRNIVMTGTNSSYGEEHLTVEKDEHFPLRSHYPYFLDSIFPSAMNYYRDSKTLARNIALKTAAENNLNLTILEPSWVFGPGELHGGFYPFIKSIQEGLRFVPGSAENLFPVIYAPDLAKTYVHVFTRKLQGQNVYILTRKEKILMKDFYDKLCIQAKLKPPARLPKWCCYPIGFFLEMLYTIFKINKAPLLTRARVNMFYDHVDLSVKKAINELEVEETPIDEAIEETIQWYQTHGWL